MHPWNLNTDEAKMLQESLAEDCVFEGDPEVETVAALDVSVRADSRLGFASAVLFSLEEKRVLERVVLIDDMTFPYIPGLLAFREAPLMLKATVRLNREPDCLLVDGHGYAHPRRFGLACHLGLLLELPSIGCAENILVGEYEEPGPSQGNHTDIWDGEPVGYAFRSMESANPIFLSPGHKISRDRILDVIEPLCNGEVKLPEPLHLADRLARSERSRIERITRPFLQEMDNGGVFLVGGSLRDLLMGNMPNDYDLLVTSFPDGVRTELEDRFEASWFVLDEERSVYRLPGQSAQVDLKVVDADDVVDDLMGRDFTVDSIGLDLNRECWVDPAEGRRDLQKNLLRPTREDSLEEDPLRILRAYRLAQQLGLRMTGELLESIEEYGSLVDRVSRERVVDELLRISHGESPATWYVKMHEHGLIAQLSFFRYEGPSDVEVLDGWTPVLDQREWWSELRYHGSFSMIDGLKAGRVISQRNLEDWPFHRDIRRVVRSSHKPLEVQNPPERLRKGRQNLIGALIGRGLLDGWSSDRLGTCLDGLERYLEERARLEKEIVEELRSKDHSEIGPRKSQMLKEKLPVLWNRTVGRLITQTPKKRS